MEHKILNNKNNNNVIELTLPNAIVRSVFASLCKRNLELVSIILVLAGIGYCSRWF